MNLSIHKKSPSKIFLFTLILSIQICSCFHWDGNILYDLETNTQSDFTIETVDWIVSNYKTPGIKFYNCANNFVMGGYNVLGGVDGAFPAPTVPYFQRTYSTLPTHNQIYIQMRFFQLDSWDYGQDYFHFAIDGNSISGWQLDLSYSGTYSLYGNSTYPDFVFTISLAYPHSATSLTLRMISYANEDTTNESFGFRNIQIEFLTNTSPYFGLCAPGVPSSYLSSSRCPTSCASPGNTIQPASYGFCLPPSCSSNCKRCSTTSTACTSCQTGWFLVGTTCYPTCDYPLSTKLLGGVTYCETPCPGQYAWWDGICSSSCSYATTYSPYAIIGTTVSSFLECQYPCATNEFLSWNTSCLSTCPSPLLTTTYRNRKFCEYPCVSSEFLYWNRCCLSTCPSPLSAETQGTSQQRKFCWYTCPATQYLYWNGSCLSTCPSPLSAETQGTSQPRNFCWYPCQPSEYLYWNGSCLSTCPSPLAPEVQGTSPQRKFCWYQCTETQYLYWNSSCLNTCPYPLVPEIQHGVSSSRNFCWYPCPDTEFLYWNGSCINTCPSPLSPETQGTIQQRNFCWYTCQPSEYLYWNGSCLNSCSSPLSPETQSLTQPRNFCWYPCAETDFLFWNGSCLNTCPSPLSPETQGLTQQRNFCWYPCQQSGYLYWNESCIDKCPYPLTPEIQGTSQPRNFCWYSCQPSEYLYWNGSCINNCPSPLSPETQGITQQRDFCWYTCQPSEYLYWNQSCSSHCPIPLVSFDLSGNQFCFLPCDLPNIYWYQDFSCRSECKFPFHLVLHDSVSQCLKPCNRPSEHFYDLEKECHDTCDPPYVRQIINTIKVCHIDASTLSAEIDKVKSTAEIIETLGKMTSTILKATSILQLSTPRSPLLIQLSSLIQYIRYMRINYPWRVQLLFQSNGASLITLSFDFSIPNKIQDKFDDYPLPDVFEKYNLESNFINNMWDLINTVLVVLLVICALLLLKAIFRRNSKITLVLKRILQSLRWNIPIAMISGGAGEIIFYASLQIRNTPLGSAISIVSFLISLGMILLILVILEICLKLLRGFHLQRRKVTPTTSSESQDWLHKWKGYEILYEEIEEKYLFSRAYMVIYVTRTILFFTTIANLYDYPLTQSILINVINLLIFLYLLYYKPLKDIWNSIQLFINEILGNILTICVLALAIMDKAKIEARYSRVTIGNVMIVIMLIFYVLGVVFLVIEGILFLIKAYKTWNEMRARGIKNPLKMIQILLFGEAKTPHKENTLDLSQTSSRLNISTIHTTGNNSLVKLQKTHNINCSAQIKERKSSIMSDTPLNISSRFSLPIHEPNLCSTQRPELEIPRTKIQSIELERETFRANLPMTIIESNIEFQCPPKETDLGENIPELILPESSEASLRPNFDFIQSWGIFKARMKRKNPSIHKVHMFHKE